MRVSFLASALFMAASAMLPGQSPAPKEGSPAKPYLIITPGTIRSNHALGSQVSQDLNRCWIRDANLGFGFDPHHPLGPTLKSVSLEGIPSEHEVDFHGERVLHSDGRTILQGVPGRAWFHSERRFGAFRVLDDRHVALFWVHEGEPEPRPFRFTTWDGEKIRERQTSLVEIWDASSRLCLHKEPMPPAITDVLDLFRPIAMGSIQTSLTCGYLLMYFPFLQQVYAFDTQENRLRQLEVPWPSLEAKWLKPALSLHPRSQGFSLCQGEVPGTTLSISPGDAGELLFGYTMAMTHKLRREMESEVQPMIPKGFTMLVPPLDKEGSKHLIHLAAWKPGRHAIEPVSSTGHPSLEDGEELQRLGWWMDLQSGLYASPDRKVMPYSLLVKQMRETLTLRTKEQERHEQTPGGKKASPKSSRTEPTNPASGR